MNGNNKQNSTTLSDLILNFEDLMEKGRIGTFNKDEFLQLINFYQSKNDYDKALEIVDYAIYQHKHIVTFYLVKSNLLLNCHKPKSALKYIEHCENISPYDYEIKIIKAKAFGMQGRITEAWAILEEMDTMPALNYIVDINIVKSFIYEYNHEYDKMFNVLKDTLIIDPQNTEVLRRINLATLLSKKYEESMEFHKKLVDGTPYNYMAWYNMGQISTELLNYSEALDYFEYSFLINPEFEEGYLEYTELCIQVGDYRSAVVVYEEYMEKFEPDEDIYINIIDSYLKLGNIDKARHYVFKTIKMDPYNDEAYFLLGKIYSSEEKWSKALNAFFKAIELEDGREEYYEAVARMYLKLEDFNKAETYYDILLGMHTLEVQYYIDYINFLIKQHKYDKAYDIITYSEEIVYSPLFNFFKSIINFKKNNKKVALYQLDNALAEDYEDYKIIFDIAPELQYDKDINSMINYYRS